MMKTIQKYETYTLLLSLFVLAGIVCSSASIPKSGKAATPVDCANDWSKRHIEKMMQMNEGESKLLLIGDSIMQGWESHKELYETYFGGYQPLNLGFYGDQTQNVLWHLDHLPLNRIQPKVALVLIGTNNVGFFNGMSADETSKGIKRIVEKLQTSFPAMQIIVLKVFPRDSSLKSFLRKRIDILNERLTETLKGMNNVHLVDLNSGLLDEKRVLRRELFADHIHLNEAGYDYWGKTIVPVIERYF